MGELSVFIHIDLLEIVMIFDNKRFLFFKLNSFWLDWVEFQFYGNYILPDTEIFDFEVCNKLCKPKIESIYVTFDKLRLEDINLVYDLSWFIKIGQYFNFNQISVYIYTI